MLEKTEQANCRQTRVLGLTNTFVTDRRKLYKPRNSMETSGGVENEDPENEDRRPKTANYETSRISPPS